MQSLYLPDLDAVLRYQVMPGNGTPIVWLAGLNFSCLAGLGHIAGDSRFAARPNVLIDYIGTGQSEAPADFPHTPEAHADTIAAVLDRESIRDAAVIGHSMGGTVAIYLALARADLVSHLIACEANLAPGGGAATRVFAARDETEFAERYFPELLRDNREKAKTGDTAAGYLTAGWQNSDPRGIHRSSVALVDLPDDFRDRYLALPMRKTFVYGEASLPDNTGGPAPDTPDPAFLQEHGVDIVIIPDAGHAMMADNPDAFAAALARAIAE